MSHILYHKQYESFSWVMNHGIALTSLIENQTKLIHEEPSVTNLCPALIFSDFCHWFEKCIRRALRTVHQVPKDLCPRPWTVWQLVFGLYLFYPFLLEANLKLSKTEFFKIWNYRLLAFRWLMFQWMKRCDELSAYYNTEKPFSNRVTASNPRRTIQGSVMDVLTMKIPVRLRGDWNWLVSFSYPFVEVVELNW